MASEVTAVNAALTLLGDSRIISLDDEQKPAREAKAIFEIVRDAVLAAHNWRFAKARAQLAQMVTPPKFQYSYKYQLPSDCLRVVMVGDFYMGMDLTDYRSAPVEEMVIEGREILTNLGAPLNLKYIRKVTDVAQWDPCFLKTFAAQLAMDLCEPLTQSQTKFDKAERTYRKEVADAIRVNAIEQAPVKLADDEWLLSRL